MDNILHQMVRDKRERLVRAWGGSAAGEWYGVWREDGSTHGVQVETSHAQKSGLVPERDQDHIIAGWFTKKEYPHVGRKGTIRSHRDGAAFSVRVLYACAILCVIDLGARVVA